MLFISLLFLYISLIGTSLLWSRNYDNYLAEEADRCLNRQCEISDTHNSEEFRRRAYFHSINGLSVVVGADGKKRFIKTCRIIY